jgi:SAM-dependent methyltransferase
MNYKLLLPTYRTRFLFVQGALASLGGTPLPTLLNLGCGEGDIDRMLKRHCDALYACDINAGDVAYASELNRDVPGIEYSVADATALPYPSARFAAIVCIDVIEHVSDARALAVEVARTLAPGGHAVITYPSCAFPVTYDPINRLLASFGTHLPLGAYGYGHDHLIDDAEFEGWVEEAGLRVLQRHTLTHALAAAAELYWPGFAQKLLKANAGNQADQGKRIALHPSAREPAAVALVDALIQLDQRLFARGGGSVGVGYVLRKPG